MINIQQAEKYCTDYTKIENYEKALNDDTQTWQCHHRNEIDMNLSRRCLINKGLYYDRPACELIFLTKSEHNTLHNSNLREETKVKKSESLKGHTAWYKGKPHSEEAKKKMSESHKGKRCAAKQCTINGKTYRCKKDAWLEICPEVCYDAFLYRYKNNYYN